MDGADTLGKSNQTSEVKPRCSEVWIRISPFPKVSVPWPDGVAPFAEANGATGMRIASEIAAIRILSPSEFVAVRVRISISIVKRACFDWLP